MTEQIRPQERELISIHVRDAAEVSTMVREMTATVARRAGHSIAVLFRFYAKAIHRNQQCSNEQIERALEAADSE